MKLAFSTIGCPNWTFDEIFAAAKDLGYDAIEIRGLGHEIYVPKIKEFSDFYVDSTMEKLVNAGLAVSMFTSSAVIGCPESVEAGKTEAFDYVDLAYKANVPFIRIMVSPNPEPEETDIACAADAYSEICEYADGKNVCPLIETNGIFSESSVLAKFMQGINSKNKGVLWDINHPFHFFNEKAEQTYGNIGEYLKYLHIKDSARKNGKIEYRMTGYGDLPVTDILKLLKKDCFDGFLSLEWTKRWLPELQEPGIVFGHYVNHMRDMIKKLT